MLALVTLPTLGAGNRLRIEQYAPGLAAHGISLDVSAFFDAPAHRVLYRPGNTRTKAAGVLAGMARRVADLARAHTYDLVFLYRESAPVGPPLFERALAISGIPYVLDFDDAIFLRAPFSANARWEWLRHPSRLAPTIRLARAVIVGNEYLAEYARRWNEDVTIIPTPIDTDRHRPRAEADGRQPVVGWVGSHTTAPYLHILDEPLRLLAETDSFIMRVIGGAYAHDAAQVDVRPYDLEGEPNDVAGFDIGVLPEPDDLWTRGKGAFKALAYMAAGLPVVASRVGVNPEVIVDGTTGYIASGTEEWVASLRRLIRDPALRRALGQRGRERVEERYSLKAQTPRLAEVLTRAASVV